mmetsp:Transcript_27282/g.65335  ORF Transcript_27282/g.65335 Transcript_27282/m.65335 type:complete len:99 (-) Transcript_27282:211-507(-)
MHIAVQSFMDRNDGDLRIGRLHYCTHHHPHSSMSLVQPRNVSCSMIPCCQSKSIHEDTWIHGFQTELDRIPSPLHTSVNMISSMISKERKTFKSKPVE